MSKLTGKVTQAVSHLYSDKAVMDKAANGTHNGESMEEIWAKINSATNLRRDESENGRVDYYMQNSKNGHWDNVGWSQTRGDGSFGMGWFDDKAYARLEFPEESKSAMSNALGGEVSSHRVRPLRELDENAHYEMVDKFALYESMMNNFAESEMDIE